MNTLGKGQTSFSVWGDHQTMSNLTKVVRYPYNPCHHLYHNEGGEGNQ